jgi:dephospho-CoA kinase
MLTVGLTGGIASGKSTVAAMLEERGARLVDADAVAREVVRPGQPVLEEIKAVFGPEMVDREGRLDRARLRERIFGDEDARRRLNALVHPAVARRVGRELERLAAAEPGGVAVVDVPLLFETNTAHRYDQVVVVWVPREVQAQRLMDRDGLDRAQAEQALQAQMPLDEKRRLANFVVDNSHGLQETRKQVEALWSRLRSLAAAQSQP